MRKIIFQMMVSVDGYYEGPNKEIDWHVVDDEFNEYAFDFLNQLDTLIFGRITYELMANYWPTEEAIKNDPLVANRMNEIEKVVVSRTLTNPKWKNSRRIQGNPEEEIRKIKQQPGKDIAIFGSSDLALSLIRAGLIDEFRILINPVLLGKGKPLFLGLPNSYKLKLKQTRIFKSGNILLSYQPV
ncbi:dihydrofolate reductase [Leptospira sp. 201903071]|uniref:dihydrofolate reductase family protein n=1 Tax=Leptospira ainazelensis TaxID=2810034 RepID=UPI001963C4E5|nr:dihydrofolate reductase family protein [Leptospira ainazelensis]MBM9499186.1 dihydrofolate reductase [Leptospira ainazelensis]